MANQRGLAGKAGSGAEGFKMPGELNGDNPQVNSVNATSVFKVNLKSSGLGGVASTLESPGLECHALSAGKWLPKIFPPGKTLLKIGSSPSDCDLCLPNSPDTAKVHAVLRLICTQWFLVESAQVRSMLVNGMKRPQAIVQPGSGCIVRIGSSDIVLLSPQSPGAPPPSLNPDRTCIIKTKEAELKIQSDFSCLIGSHAACGIKIQDMPPFGAVIFPLVRKPQLYSLGGEAMELKLDGALTSDAPRPLRHNSSVSFNGAPAFTVMLPDALREEASQSLMQPHAGHMMLLDISGSRLGQKLILPASGRSIFIGRDPDNHFVIESSNVSRKHAQLIIYDAGVLILDCKSTNGTYVEGERVAKKMLHPGETVQFGDKLYFLCHTE